MAVVKMHQAKDGSLHKTAKECADHEAGLRLGPAVEKFVDSIGEEDLIDAGAAEITSGVYIDLTTLPAFLVKHSATLRKLLNASLVSSRPRKGKEGEQPAKPRRVRPAATTAPAGKVAPKPKVEENPAEAAPKAASPDDDVDNLLASLEG